MRLYLLVLVALSACTNNIGLKNGECKFVETFQQTGKNCYSLCGRGNAESTEVTEIPCPKTRWFFEP